MFLMPDHCSQLHLYVCGSYQIKMSRNDQSDHINEANNFKFMVAKESASIKYAKY